MEEIERVNAEFIVRLVTPLQVQQGIYCNVKYHIDYIPSDTSSYLSKSSLFTAMPT